MKASTIAIKTTYTVLFIAGQFRVYKTATGTSFGRACKEMFASDSWDTCALYVKGLEG